MMDLTGNHSNEDLQQENAVLREQVGAVFIKFLNE